MTGQETSRDAVIAVPEASSPRVRCPYCRDGLAGEGEVFRCGLCLTAMHAECAGLHGRCVTWGCAGGAPASASAVEGATRGLAAFIAPLDDACLAAAAAAGACALVVLALAGA